MIHGIHVIYEGMSLVEFEMVPHPLDINLLSGWLTAYYEFTKAALGQEAKEMVCEKFKYLFFKLKRIPVLLVLIADLNDSRSDCLEEVERINTKLNIFNTWFENFDGDQGKLQLTFEEIISGIRCSFLEEKINITRKKKEFYCSLLKHEIPIKDLHECNLLNGKICLREKEKFDQIVQLMLSFLPWEHDFQDIEPLCSFKEVFDFVSMIMEQNMNLEEELNNIVTELALSFLPFEHDFQDIKPLGDLKEISDFINDAIAKKVATN